MPVPTDFKISPVKIKRIKLAGDCRCEWCDNQYPLTFLEIHYIPVTTGNKEQVRDDLQKHVLVVCSSCHKRIHHSGYPEEIQREVIRYRPRPVKKKIRDILGYKPRRYIPPETDDPARIYHETSQPNWGWGT